MRCPSCNHDNRIGAKFCETCGAPLKRLCPSCGVELRPTAKFCDECGSSTSSETENVAAPTYPTRAPRTYTPQHLADKILQSKSALEGERKQVTVLFADVKGSMELAGKLDPEEWHRVLDRFFQILSDGVHRFEGTINQYTGDGIMALFGAPIAHEDHAQRACYAALQLREQLRDYADRLRIERGINFGVRIGINSGDVIVGKIGDDLRMDYTAQGQAVGLAQRLEQLADSGRIYLSENTQRLIEGYFALRDLGRSAVAGVGAPVGIYELEAASTLRTRLDLSRARGLSRFVGRVNETHTLHAALERARGGQGQVVGVVGEPGVGKSRLCHEFAERCRQTGIPVIEASCPAHGRNIPFIPILELYRAYFGVTAQDTAAQARQKIAGAMVLLDPALQDTLPVLFEFMGVPDPARPAETLDADARQRRLFALLRQVYRIQAERGVASVVLIDDLHWIDPASDAFIAQIVEATAENSRNLLLLNFRPEYTASWMRRAHYQQLPLAPLGNVALQELLGSLLGSDPSLGDLAQRLMRWTAGNPFYTEELVRELIEAKHLAGAPGAHQLTSDIDTLPVPANVRAILAARIDRLDERAKEVLQVAAVIGKDFAAPILQSVVARTGRSTLPVADLDAALRTLIDGEFIFEQALYPVAEYTFKHPLTQEVALGSQLQERRRHSHAAVAGAIEATNAEHLDERAALLAHHYEAAGETLVAARWYHRAAEWAGLKDIQAALHHWQKVRELARLSGEAVEAAALTAIACSQAMMLAWRFGAAAEWSTLFAEGCAAAERAQDLAALAVLNANYGVVRGVNHGIIPDYVRYTSEAVRIADCTDDATLRCGTRGFLLYALAFSGQLREAERVCDEVIALAGGDPHVGTQVMGFSPLLGARVTRQRCIAFTSDPAGLRELPLLRQQALDCGHPDVALWALWCEAELQWALASTEGADALAPAAARLAVDRGVLNEIVAALTQCYALACEGAWQLLLDAASDALVLIRKRSASRNLEPDFLAHVAAAQIELGNPAAGRVAAAESVGVMRETQCAWTVHSYAVLARAQFALREPAADIAATLDEYAALLERTAFHLHAGEMYELRARLAEREGHAADRIAALQSAHDCYTSFGMTNQAARIAAAIG